MGLGYWTSENLVYDELTGKLLTDTTWTYKPPGFKDIPADLRIYFRRNAGNEFGVLQSKGNILFYFYRTVLKKLFRHLAALSLNKVSYTQPH